MTPENFTYWLQGFIELQSTTVPSEQQWKAIKDHLALVFTKVTPDRNAEPNIDEMTKRLQDLLDKRNTKGPMPLGPYVDPLRPYCTPNTPSPTIMPPWPTYPTVICSVSGTDKITSTAK
jgi:hypothetical protein